MAPNETVQRLRPLMPVMGITRIANVTGLDRIGIPVTMVCRPNSRSVASFQGKGETLAAAEASGLMEAIETYHAEHITLPLKYASFEELRYSHNMIDVEALPWVRDNPFHEYRPILWIEGYDLLGDSYVWLPYELVHTNYTRPLPTGSGVFLASSNGLASGNNLFEAISHAICEVVERDSMALWRRMPLAAQEARRIRLDTIADPACRDVIAKFKLADVDVAVWEITSDLGIPAMLCWVMETGQQDERLLGRPSVGSGCHPSREVALSRALCEAAQERLTLISGARDDLRQRFYDDIGAQGVFEIEDGIRFSSGPSKDFATCEEDVAWELEQLSRVGIRQAVMVDLTMGLVPGVAVVRVVIPGLEGVSDDPKYVPGPRAIAAEHAP